MWHRRTSVTVTAVHYVVFGCVWLGWAASLRADLYPISEDTYIDSDSVGDRDYNYGGHDKFRAVVNSEAKGGSRTRMLLALPGEIWSLDPSQIESAKLYLYLGFGNPAGRPIALYPLLSPFVEGSGTGWPDVSGATWTTSDGGTPWTPGGDYDSLDFVNSVGGDSPGWWTWDLKDLWGNADLAANGALLAFNPETDVKSGFISGTFFSSEYEFEEFRPYVDVNVVPEPATCVLFLTATVLTASGVLLRRRYLRARPE